jgi:mono/diheme cytochrome c family protein
LIRIKDRLVVTADNYSMKLAIASALAFSLISIPAMAQDISAGARVAQTWCKNCHDISPGASAMHDTGAPPFAVVANSKGTTSSGLTVFLYTSHNRMPDYSLTRKEAADASAYIMSLKAQGPAKVR